MTRSLIPVDGLTLVLLLGTIVLLAFGQVMFKFAAGVIDISRPQTLLSPILLAALTVYGVATAAWIVVLSRVPLSIAFPFYGLTFLVVPVLARLVLGEPIRSQAIWGGIVILIGVAISSWKGAS